MKNILIFIAALFLGNNVSAQLLQMEPLAGPNGLLANDFVVNDMGEILVNIPNTNFEISKDGGNTWIEINHNGGINPRNGVAHPDGDFFMNDSFLDPIKIDRATLKIDTLNSINRTVMGKALFIQISKAGTLFILTEIGKIYSSTDKGETWTLFHDFGIAPETRSFLRYSKNSDELIAVIKIAVGQNEIIHRFDIQSGATVDRLQYNGPQSVNGVAIANGKVLFSIWDKILDFNLNEVAVLPGFGFEFEAFENNDLIFYTKKGFYHSSDAGATWGMLNPPLFNINNNIENSTWRNRVMFDKFTDSWIFNFDNSSFSTLQRASKDFSTWTPFIRKGSYISSMLMMENDSMLVTTKRDGRFISSDYGSSYRHLNINNQIGINALTYAENGVFVAIGEDNKLYKSIDYGQNWLPINLNLALNDELEFIVGNRQGTFAAFAKGRLAVGKVYYSNDYWETWKIISSDQIVHNIAIDASGNVYGYRSPMFLSSDLLEKYNSAIDAWEPVFRFDIRSLPEHFISVINNHVIATGNKNGREIRLVSDDEFQTYYQTTHDLPNLPFETDWKHLKNGTIYSIFQSKTPFNFPNTYNLNITQNEGLIWQTIVDVDRSIGSIKSAVMDKDNYLYLSFIDNVIHKSTTPLQLYNKYITGKVFYDTDENCLYDNNADIEMPKAIVRAAGVDTFYVSTPSNGFYSIPVPNGSYEVSVILSDSLWQPCTPSQTVSFAGGNDSVFVNFPMKTNVLCTHLNVDLTTPFLRRCFPNNNYVTYENNGSKKAIDAYIEVELDRRFQIDSSGIPIVSQVGDTYRFDVGDIDVFEEGNFYFRTTMICDSVNLDETICAEARIFPDSICYQPTNWSGASLEANVECLGDSIKFTISNVGTGDMISARQFVIIEDLIIMDIVPFDLDTGESESKTILATGSTYHMETLQEENHPGYKRVGATIERCGMGPYSIQLFNQFIQNGNSPSHDVECRVVRGAYDPNDKSAIPTGIGMEHMIQPNTSLEYLIRFQNTGTDTAFTVVLIDSLSHLLDLSTLQIGAGSHDFTFEVYENGILRFDFNNIMLPDSNVNEVASNGFVKYTIALKPDVPIGSTVYNSADIYFDFNDPIRTNETFHLVDEPWVLVKTSEVFVPKVEVNAYPNPFQHQATIKLSNAPNGLKTFSLFDISGKHLRYHQFDGSQFIFEKQTLPNGIYFYEIRGKGTKIAIGKLIVQ